MAVAGCPENRNKPPCYIIRRSFFVIALAAALFGFGGTAVGAVELAKIPFFVFLAIAVTALIIGLPRPRPR
jgi:uncharacterized membrane protein YtjA (UPF0391 family)